MTALLTVEDVATELQVKPLAVRRLISLRLLNATLVGRDFRIVPADLQSYVSKGAQRLAMPPMEHDGGWLSLQTVNDDAAALEQSFRKMLGDVVPTDRPTNARDGEYSTVDVKPPALMLALLKEPPKRSKFVVPGTPLPPYATNADEFAAAKLSAILRRLTLSPVNGASGLPLLYRSPDDFQTLTDQGWTEYQKQSVGMRKTYPALNPYNGPAQVTFSVSCSNFGSSKANVIQNML